MLIEINPFDLAHKMTVSEINQMIDVLEKTRSLLLDIVLPNHLKELAHKNKLTAIVALRKEKPSLSLNQAKELIENYLTP